MCVFYVAIRKGSWRNLDDIKVMLCTQSEYVHAEILVTSAKVGTTVTCGAWAGVFPTFQARNPFLYNMSEQDYTYFKIPLVYQAKAWDILQEILVSELEYETGWQCLLPEWTLFMTEKDIDVIASPPREWKRVFCSQVVLLFLKKCILLGLLSAPEWKHALSLHSYHCSPGVLFLLCESLCKEQTKRFPVFQVNAFCL